MPQEQTEELENKVRRWMKRNKQEYTDPQTGELNSTLLAEAAAVEFDLHDHDVDATIDDWVFDLAVEVDE